MNAMSHLRSIKRLPTPEEVISAAPLSDSARAGVLKHRQEVRDILDGTDPRLLVIVGPCSAWPAPAVLEYARRLRALSDELSPILKLVLRCYIQKPRTTKGWTGPVNQPDPFARPDIAEGMRYARRMMVEVVEMGLPIADEAVFTHNAKGFTELLTWVAIGARSSEDQEHRIWASAQGFPVGLKNPTGGSIDIAVNSVLAAQSQHTAVFDGFQVETAGNAFAHLILRGGALGPNYALHDLYRARKLLQDADVAHPALLVDASHDNCKIDGVKHPQVQVDVVREVLSNLKVRPELQDTVRGLLLESFLLPGNQKLERCSSEDIERGGLSITDPCLGWEETAQLLRDTAERVAELRGGQMRLKRIS